MDSGHGIRRPGRDSRPQQQQLSYSSQLAPSQVSKHTVQQPPQVPAHSVSSQVARPGQVQFV